MHRSRISLVPFFLVADLSAELSLCIYESCVWNSEVLLAITVNTPGVSLFLAFRLLSLGLALFWDKSVLHDFWHGSFSLGTALLPASYHCRSRVETLFLRKLRFCQASYRCGTNVTHAHVFSHRFVRRLLRVEPARVHQHWRSWEVGSRPQHRSGVSHSHANVCPGVGAVHCQTPPRIYRFLHSKQHVRMSVFKVGWLDKILKLKTGTKSEISSSWLVWFQTILSYETHKNSIEN